MSMEYLFSLRDKKYLVTGGTRGIGRAVTLRFAEAGAAVVANYAHNEEAALELLRLAEPMEGTVDVCRADLTTPKGLACLAEHFQGVSLSGLVHCAATGVHLPISKLRARQFDWVYSLNIRAFFELIQIVIPLLSAGSSIVVLSSSGAVRAVQDYALIGSSKGALESFSRHLAAELAPEKIRVNILCPGSVKTESWDAVPDRESRLEKTITRTPLGRLVTVEEVAAAAHFLCSDASSGFIGHRLVLDGGAGIVE